MAEFHSFNLSSLSVMVILQFGNLSNATPVFVMTAKASLRFGFIGNSGNYKHPSYLALCFYENRGQL